MMIARRILGVALAFGLALPLAAQTLERVRESNTLTLGFVDQLQPFSSGPVDQPSGYVIELCQRIAARVARDQALPQLRLVYRQFAREEALAALQDGQMDLLCSPLVASLERRRSVSFSLPVYPSGRGVAVRDEVPPYLLRVLEGRVERTAPQWRATLNRGLARGTFAVIAGSTTEQWARQQLRLLGVVSEVVPVQSFAEGTALLESGKADAFFGDRAVLLFPSGPDYVAAFFGCLYAGVIAVPASSAQAVAGLLCDAGVLGIVNFAPVNIKVPQKTPVIPVDISQEFLKLAFCIQRARRREQEERLQIEAASGAD